MGDKVLALYDFASKQEFIYRTSKIKEISGASELLSGIYKKLIDEVNASKEFFLKYNTEETFHLNDFEFDETRDGEVLYDGGGNLMVLYRNKNTFIEINKLISVYLLKNVPSLQLISCCVKVEGDFEKDRKRLYHQNRINKNFYPNYELTAVTPMTQTDPMTFMPVVHKDTKTEQSLSADRFAKQKAYDWRKNKDYNDIDNLQGLTAVIYIDGNSMGKKLIQCSDSDYDEGVRKLREFSAQVNRDYVEEPLKQMRNYSFSSKHKGFRRVIGGGDEITIICDAQIALELVFKYFETLESTNIGKKTEEKNFSCAGIAVFHAKAPFTIAYEIAEAACESAKQRAHRENGNYFDFYYCHAGVTTDFETLRAKEQSITMRPYRYEEAKTLFEEYIPILQAMGRSNVKALCEAAQMSKATYSFEVKRINSYLGSKGYLEAEEDKNKNEIGIIYDMSEFYDLWFSKEAVNNEKDA